MTPRSNIKTNVQGFRLWGGLRRLILPSHYRQKYTRQQFLEVRRPQKIAQTSQDAEGPTQILAFTSYDRRLYISMNKTNKDWPAGSRFSVVIEHSPPGTVHEHRWLTSGVNEPMSDPADTQRLAIRLENEYTRDDVTYVKIQYLKSARSGQIVEHTTGARS